MAAAKKEHMEAAEALAVLVDLMENSQLQVGVMMQIPDHSLELSQRGNEAESDMEAEDEQDVAYNPDTSPEPSTDSDTEMDPSHKPESIALCSPTKIRKRKPHQWKSNIRKKLRLEGDAHTNSVGKHQQKRELGPMCTSAFCKKSNLRNCSSLEETDRKEIFTSFWGMKSWECRKNYIQALVTAQPIKQKKNTTSSRRHTSLFYALKKFDGSIVSVCKKMFCSTLGISKRTIGSWTSGSFCKRSQGELLEADESELRTTAHKPKTKSPCSGKTKPVSEEDMKHLKIWLLDLPTVECHYCRQTDTYRDKKFLFPGTKKNLAREKKEKDKDDAKDDNSKSVWTMDLQAVHLSPKTNASSAYYKTKVQVHNMTYFNLGTKEGFCYTWDECNGNLSSEMFAYIHYIHFENYVKANPGKKHYIIWSDNCCHQNKNVTVANLLYHLARKYNVTIDQKFLVTGHTQMECDSMHSTIERNIQMIDIFTPTEYAVLFRTSRKRPFPYTVVEIEYHHPVKLGGQYFTSIRPGKGKGDPTVGDLKAIRYERGEVQYKLSHNDDWEMLPQRVREVELDTLQLFHQQSQITQRKFQDVVSMLSIMPTVHAKRYFENLPND
ncbi:hypothetical protein RRG08_061079 [Elysia crispata]|uniref:DUF7869 domain-containing protein n=1 Tax=Elysia crispata TaxID=231223 RepID=A0AAE0YXU7_9GAST|nr:hypothetical protein RRG08_061079 [Elysia crispata]